MKKAISLTLAASLVALCVSAPSLAENVKSLRGASEIDTTKQAEDLKKVHRDQAPIPRNYVQQPPLIPHQIRHYEITKDHNKCMDCHSWQNYQDFGATKISQTHFTDRDGVELTDVSPRRYFCTQCHVPQADAQPLVDNEFKPVKSMKK